MANRLWKNHSSNLLGQLDRWDVQRLLRCKALAEKECRQADRPGQPADRGAALQAQVSCAATIQACLGQIEPGVARKIRRSAPDVTSFAQALSQRLSREQAQAAAAAYAADPLVKVVLGPR